MRLVVAFTAHNFVWTDLAHAFRHGAAPRQLLRRVFKSVDRSSAGIMNIGHGLSHHSSIEGNTSGLERRTLVGRLAVLERSFPLHDDNHHALIEHRVGHGHDGATTCYTTGCPVSYSVQVPAPPYDRRCHDESMSTALVYRSTCSMCVIRGLTVGRVHE